MHRFLSECLLDFDGKALSGVSFVCVYVSVFLCAVFSFVQIADYRNAVIVARNPSSMNKATSYADRLRLGVAMIHGEQKEPEDESSPSPVPGGPALADVKAIEILPGMPMPRSCLLCLLIGSLCLADKSVCCSFAAVLDPQLSSRVCFSACRQGETAVDPGGRRERQDCHHCRKCLLSASSHPVFCVLSHPSLSYWHRWMRFHAKCISVFG